MIGKFIKTQYKGMLVGFAILAMGAGTLAGVISTAKSATDGDVITASAWNDLLSKINSGGSGGGGSGIACTSEGQSNCTINSNWSCDYGWDNSIGGCSTVAILGSQSSTPGTSCKHILDNRNDIDGSSSSDDGLYWIDPDGDGGETAFQAYCDMSTDGGGWTTFFATKNGSPNVIGEYEVGNLPCTNPESSCMRYVPNTLTTSTVFAASLGEKMVKFNFVNGSTGVDYLKNGTSSQWQNLENQVVIKGTVSIIPTMLWTGEGTRGNNGLILSDDVGHDTSKTFLASYDFATVWNVGDGVADTSSNIKLYYR